MNVKLERSIGIPTVPFAPVKVTVAIEGDLTSPSDAKNLSDKLDSLMAMEIVKTLEESVTITNIGYKKYLETLQNNYHKIMKALED
jgi:hypothetical protein